MGPIFLGYTRYTLYCVVFFLGMLTFCSLIIFYMKFEFGFAEGARVTLGWTEETEIEEIFGYVFSAQHFTIMICTRL